MENVNLQFFQPQGSVNHNRFRFKSMGNMLGLGRGLHHHIFHPPFTSFCSRLVEKSMYLSNLAPHEQEGDCWDEDRGHPTNCFEDRTTNTPAVDSNDLVRGIWYGDHRQAPLPL